MAVTSLMRLIFLVVRRVLPKRTLSQVPEHFLIFLIVQNVNSFYSWSSGQGERKKDRLLPKI